MGSKLNYYNCIVIKRALISVLPAFPEKTQIFLDQILGEDVI